MGQNGGKMGINQDGLLMVKARISDQIDGIAADVAASRGALDLTQRLESLRQTAADHGLITLSRIAGQCASASAGGAGRVAFQPWISALRDALGCSAEDADAARTLSALVSQRLYG
jgi:hypothetical protein